MLLFLVRQRCIVARSFRDPSEIIFRKRELVSTVDFICISDLFIIIIIVGS